MIFGYCQYHTGCCTVLLIPRAEKGKRLDGEWFDEDRITVSEQGKDLNEIIETPAKILGERQGTEMPVGGDIAPQAK